LVAGAAALFSRFTGPEISGEFSAKLANFSNNQAAPAQVGELEGAEEINTVSAATARQGYTQADVDAIRLALAERFNLDMEQVLITLGADSTAEFATGLVNVGEGAKGGIYFAAKTENGWQIAHDGRGILECTLANKYNFPSGFIPRCFNAQTGENIDR
jgi:hypothetical protein